MSDTTVLTESQIKNWRNTLSMTLGPYAFIMPVEQIQKFRDMMQKKANELKEEDCE